MKVIYINLFLESVNYILESFSLSCQVGSPSLRESPFSGKEILAVVGVTGEKRGQIYMGLPKVTALKIVSKMMGGTAVTEFDSMAQSAISELTNMICGNAMTRFSKEGILLDITPPTLILGSQMEVAAVKMRVLSIPIDIDRMNAFEMNVALED